MDLLGNLANLKVDTVLSAVDKYVPGEWPATSCAEVPMPPEFSMWDTAAV